MKMHLTSSYNEQRLIWPEAGRHILARYDDENIVVYQAYRKSIGCYAAKKQIFGGDFSFGRMSWIKPNFLWMMYRSGWGTKEGQEVTLAVTIPRALFDGILRAAVPSSFSRDLYPDTDSWKQAVADSDVRLQWDPDHCPSGTALDRRAIQLGLRGEILNRYAKEEVVQIEDISGFVDEQRKVLRDRPDELNTPTERVYQPGDSEISKRLRLDTDKESTTTT